MSRTTVVWNISLPPSMAKEAEDIAQKEARTKSELVREALRQYLWTTKMRKLEEYGKMKTKKTKIKEEDIEKLVDELRQ
ncbi:MAG: ribbon-helix-helix protein, CopG family [bacterium]